MKIESLVEKFHNTIQQASRLTGKNLTLPILSSILLSASKKKLKARATNLSLGVEIDIPAKVLGDGEIAIQGSILNNIFSTLDQFEKVTLETINNNLSIKTKKNDVLVKSFSSEDFPTLPRVSGKNFNILAKKFIEGIKSVFYGGSISEIKPEISSVYVYGDEDNIVFVSTDTFRLAEKKIKLKKIINIPGILIPLKNIPEIIRFFSDSQQEIKIDFSKNQISFTQEDLYLTSRLVDGTFPDYKQIIPNETNTEVIVLKQDLLNALKLSNVFSNKLNQVTLDVKPNENTFEIYSENADVGENKTQIDASLNGEDIEMNFNQKYFLDCFQSIPQDSIVLKFSQSNKPMIIQGVNDNSFTYLIMPMNR